MPELKAEAAEEEAADAAAELAFPLVAASKSNLGGSVDTPASLLNLALYCGPCRG